MLGVQDHRDVEGVRVTLARALAVQHREEVLGVGERRVGCDRLEALAAPVVARDHRRQLRDQLHRSRLGERRDRGAEYLHRRGARGLAVDRLGGLGGQLALLGQLAR